MEVLLLLIGAALGGLISWYISKYWSNVSSKETRDWVQTDLVKSIKDILVKKPQDVDWTTEQIVALYRQSTFKGKIQPKIADINHCAKCGNTKLQYDFYRKHGLKAYALRCSECDWSFLDDREDLPEKDMNLIIEKYERYEN